MSRFIAGGCFSVRMCNVDCYLVCRSNVPFESGLFLWIIIEDFSFQIICFSDCSILVNDYLEDFSLSGDHLLLTMAQGNVGLLNWKFVFVVMVAIIFIWFLWSSGLEWIAGNTKSFVEQCNLLWGGKIVVRNFLLKFIILEVFLFCFCEWTVLMEPGMQPKRAQRSGISF